MTTSGRSLIGASSRIVSSIELPGAIQLQRGRHPKVPAYSPAGRGISSSTTSNCPTTERLVVPQFEIEQGTIYRL